MMVVMSPLMIGYFALQVPAGAGALLGSSATASVSFSSIRGRVGKPPAEGRQLADQRRRVRSAKNGVAANAKQLRGACRVVGKRPRMQRTPRGARPRAGEGDKSR